MTTISTTVDKNPLEGMVKPFIVNKSLKCSTWLPFNITVFQVYAPTTDAEENEAEWFYEDLQDLLELTPTKMPFSS